AGYGIEEFSNVIVHQPRQDGLAVRAEGGLQYHALNSEGWLKLFARGGVPKAQLKARREERFAIGTESHIMNLAEMVEHGPKRFAVGDIPDPRLTLQAAKSAAGGQKLPAIGAEAEPRNGMLVFQGRPDQLTGCDFPEADHAFNVPGHQHPTVGGYGH